MAPQWCCNQRRQWRLQWRLQRRLKTARWRRKSRLNWRVKPGETAAPDIQTKRINWRKKPMAIQKLVDSDSGGFKRSFHAPAHLLFIDANANPGFTSSSHGRDSQDSRWNYRLTLCLLPLKKKIPTIRIRAWIRRFIGTGPLFLPWGFNIYVVSDRNIVVIVGLKMSNDKHTRWLSLMEDKSQKKKKKKSNLL